MNGSLVCLSSFSMEYFFNTALNTGKISLTFYINSSSNVCESALLGFDARITRIFQKLADMQMFRCSSKANENFLCYLATQKSGIRWENRHQKGTPFESKNKDIFYFSYNYNVSLLTANISCLIEKIYHPNFWDILQCSSFSSF